MASKSKVLVIGGTGDNIGQHIALASIAQGHSTFVLVRPTSFSSKAPLIHSFKLAGITILEGSSQDYDSLVAAIKQVDVVICAVGPSTVLDQLKIIEAIKDVGAIKRFIPSEFGHDSDRVKALEPASRMFEEKAKVRRAIEGAGIPYTYVIANYFARYFMLNLMQPGLQAPPRDKVSIYGSGDVRFISVSEEDIATYTIKAMDDPRTLNKTLHIRPTANIVTMNSMVELWEKLICKTLDKVFVTAEDMVKQIQETQFPDNLLLAILHDMFILGDLCNFELGPKDVEATTLYPDHKYTSMEEYIAKFV